MAYIGSKRLFNITSKGDSCFVRYSAHPDGTDFTKEYEGGSYIGFATGQIAPTDPTAYNWIRIAEVSVDEALDRILEIQQSLIGYTVELHNFLSNGIGGETGCYVSKTKPIQAFDFDAHLEGAWENGNMTKTLTGVRKLYVWTDWEHCEVAAYKKVGNTDELITEYFNGCSYDKALEIEIKADGTYVFFGHR